MGAAQGTGDRGVSATVLANLLRHESRDVATVRRTAEARAALARAVAMAAHPATTTKENGR